MAVAMSTASTAASASRAASWTRGVKPVPHVAPRTIAHYKLGQYSEGSIGPDDYDLKEHEEAVTTGIVFSPTAEMTKTLPTVESLKPGPSGVSRVSLGRMDYARKAEVAINEQINVELNMSYLYLSASAYFARDNVGLPGFAAHFKYASDDEREHALRLVEFQTRRGGRVALASLLPPLADFEHDEKGDALHAAEVALSLEKLNLSKLRELHSMAEEVDDCDMSHFIEDYLIDEQSREVKESAVLVSQLQRVGKGLGVFTIDYALQQKYGVKGAEAGLKNMEANNALMAVSPLLG